MQRDAEQGRDNAAGGIGVFRELARRPDVAAWRAWAQRVVPYAVGIGMFAVAIWVLHSALRRYDLADLHKEISALTWRQVWLAILFTFCSFLALIGYEWSALSLIGRRMPFGHLALASFTTQSIAHSTGFAFVIGATLRYHFYSDRGLGITDVAKVQMFFTATFTLGVATLAGGVVMVEPFRLALATGVPPLLWRIAAATALSLVTAYVIWGGFFHRPLRWRGHELVLPSASATLAQIFFGVADLLAVAAALYVLLPAGLHLGYLEVLAVFMAAIVIGLVSHVPGSLGIFESAVIVLLSPGEGQTLPLIGALLVFRAIYYLLPLGCGVLLLSVTELHRWREALAAFVDRVRLSLGPDTSRITAALVFFAGCALTIVAATHDQRLTTGALHRALPRMADAGRIVEIVAGLALILLAHGIWRRSAQSWRWVLMLLLVAAGGGFAAGAPPLLGIGAVTLALLLFACRREFDHGSLGSSLWQSPAVAVLVAMTLASSFWLIARG